MTTETIQQWPLPDHATARGLELARKLTRDLSPDYRVQRICSAIQRDARVHQRLSEEQCNGPHWMEHRNARPGEYERWEASLTKREEQCEARINERAGMLDGWQVSFQGDPRGFTVKLYPESATPEEIDNGRASCVGAFIED